MPIPARHSDGFLSAPESPCHSGSGELATRSGRRFPDVFRAGTPVPHTIRPMNGLMMDYPLTLSTIFRRAEQVFPRQEIVWRLADKSIRRYTFADFAEPRPAPRPGPPRPRPDPRRPRRHPRLEPRPAPRGLLRHPADGRRPPHPQPPPPPRRARLHRQPRRGSRDPRGRKPAAALGTAEAEGQRPHRRSSSAPRSRWPTDISTTKR